MKHLPVSLLLMGLIGFSGSVEAKTTLRLHHFNPLNRASTKVFEQAIKQFEKLNPNVSVKMEFTDYGSAFDNKIITMATAGSAPDIAMGNSFSFLKHTRLLTDLNPYLRGSDLNLDSFVESTVDAFKVDGKMLMIPYTGGPIAMYYNTKLLAEKGLPVPQKDWTFDDFTEYVAKITSLNGTKLVTQGANLVGLLGQDPWWLWGYGGDIIDKTGTKFLLGTPESVKAMRAMAELEKKKWATSYDTSAFYGGKAGFHSQGSWMITQFQVKFPFEAVHVPTGPIGKKLTTVYVNGWGIMQASKHKREAWNLVKFLVGKEWQLAMTKASGELPALASAVQDPKIFEGVKFKSLNVFLDALRYGRSDYMTRVTDRVVSFAGPAIDSAMKGKKDPAQAIEDVRRAVEQEMRRLHDNK